ncbi:MAG: LPXTG cell wall anchor domain-containing protein, partial [Eubacterium sp.]|nr:LPXTG cell wall anchor domain-containing protein [Eubacterium sp.]
VDTYGEVLELLGTPTGDAIEKPVAPGDPENPNNPNNPSDNNNNNPNINRPNLDDLLNKGDKTNGNSTTKKNVKNPFIPKTGGEGTAYVMIAVYSVLALAIGAAAVIYKKKKSDCAEK